jgi:hypothetical protein
VPILPVTTVTKEEITVNRQEIHTRRVEFIVTTVAGYGVNHAEIGKALAAASQEYFQATGGAVGDRLPDDVIRLDHTRHEDGTGEIIVFYELEKRQ